jgi:hypothetical protein
VLSIGSVGSVLSVGSVGSAGSILSIGSAFSFGAILSFSARSSLMSERSINAVLGSRARGHSRPGTIQAAVAGGAILAAVLAVRERRAIPPR